MVMAPVPVGLVNLTITYYYIGSVPVVYKAIKGKTGSAKSAH